MKGVSTFLVLFLVSLSILASHQCFAQQDSLWRQNPDINISGFIDVFYAYDMNKPKTDFRQSFLYNHNRHNEFNLNLGLIKASVRHIKYRANFAIHTGTYVNDNYAVEPGLLKNILEANIGLSLNKRNNFWLDVGIMNSHIGFESAISLDNWTLTRSLLAENSPYYLSGVKATYNPNKHWEYALIISNGWQRIQRVANSSLPSFCSQVKYVPSKSVLFNWSTFIGTNDPDSTRRMRYFNNVYGQFQINKKMGLIVGFDIGSQQQSHNSSKTELWFSPILILQYKITNQWALGLRAEYYQDRAGIMISTGTENGFDTSGFSVNIDYAPMANLACRLEGRLLNSKDKIFLRDNDLRSDNLFIVSSVALRFEK